ncbi:MAG: DUF58 domain-containing protein [Acidobacteriota bacterium]
MLSTVTPIFKAWTKRGPLWPLTGGGSVFAALSLGAWYSGRTRMDLVLSAAGLWGLVFVAITGVASGVAWFVLRRALSNLESTGAAGPLAAVEGYSCQTGLSLRRRFLPLVASPELRWVEPLAEVRLIREGSLWREEVLPLERRLGSTIIREAIAGDLFGVWRMRIRHEETRVVLIQPDPGRLPASELLSALTSGDLLPHPHARPKGDPFDNRPYTRSDPARLILWKIYARTRQLLVRAPETARQPERRPLVYLVAGAGDDASAGAARALLDAGAIGGQIPFAADGTPVPTSDRAKIREAIALSRDHRDRGGSDLSVALSDARIGADAPVLLIVPARGGSWERRVVPLIARQPERFVALSAADLIPWANSWSGAWRHFEPWLMRPKGEPFGFEELRRALTAVAGSGCRMLLADRIGGVLHRGVKRG